MILSLLFTISFIYCVGFACLFFYRSWLNNCHSEITKKKSRIASNSNSDKNDNVFTDFIFHLTPTTSIYLLNCLPS